MMKKLMLICASTVIATTANASDQDANLQVMYATVVAGSELAFLGSLAGATYYVWRSNLPLRQKLSVTAKMVAIGAFMGGGTSLLACSLSGLDNSTPNYSKMAVPVALGGGVLGTACGLYFGNGFSDNPLHWKEKSE